MSVVIETTLGDFTVDLFVAERPYACKNFLKLCKIKYYNLCLFHSVQHNFIAQTGDPTGTGKNGESVFGRIHGEQKRYFEAEMMPKIKHSRSGLLSMVNCGDNMLGSQFFVTLGGDLQSLDGEHCVFGEVAEGQEALFRLNEAICDVDHRPYQDVRITHTVVLEDPFEDPPGLQVPDGSPEPTKENLLNSRIAPDEDLDETKGLSAAELAEIVRDREAQAQATILEIVGDLPDADMAPPENVLFVCKLNPVTTDDDLEIIFSRFGKVKGCEVIRDKSTGDSLQYAFVEFEEQKSCEDAFFKMDNVLIDDRRIHVDFSQSVSKLRWKGKGRGVEHIGDDSSKKERPRNEGNQKKDDRQTSFGAKKAADENSRTRDSGEDSRQKRSRDDEGGSSRRRDEKVRQHERSGNRQHHDKGRSDYRDDRDSRSRLHNSDRSHSNRDERDQRVRREDHNRAYSNRDMRNERPKDRSQDNSRGYVSREERTERVDEGQRDYHRSDRSNHYSNREKESERSRHHDYERDSRQSYDMKTRDKYEEDRGRRKRTNEDEEVVARKRQSEDVVEARRSRSRDDGRGKTSKSRNDNEKELKSVTNRSVEEKSKSKKHKKELEKKVSSSSGESSSSSSSSSDSTDRKRSKQNIKRKNVKRASKEKVKRKKTSEKKKKRKVSSSSSSSDSSSSEEEAIAPKRSNKKRNK